MKNVILALVSMFSLNAFATSPALPPENGLVMMNRGGGMPVPGGIRYRQIVITHAGEVKVKEALYGTDLDDIFEGGIEREYLLGTVGAADLEALEQTAARVTGGNLTKPEGPQCTDAPKFTYGVIKGRTTVTAFTTFNCRASQLADKHQRPAALAIKNYLDQWNAIR